MTDLLLVAPDFDAAQFAHLLHSLDRHHLTTADLLTLDALDVAKRAQLPLAEVRRLAGALIAELRIDEQRHHDNDGLHAISTLDAALDAELGGGIPAGYVTEITGESGAGKTQLLLTLLLSAQLASPSGLAKSAVYISTESALPTPRLLQLLSTHPRLADLQPQHKPSLARVLSIQTPDLESQDHILRYQLPVAIAAHNVGLVVIDSVAANFRAEFERGGVDNGGGGAQMARRSAQLVTLGALLRRLAREHGVAVVVANQVSDRFEAPSHPYSQQTQAQAHDILRTPAGRALTLDHQQRWFTGWGDGAQQDMKTPALGLVWANQIAARVALVKVPVWGGGGARKPASVMEAVFGPGEGEGEEERQVEVKRWRRWMRVVFAAWGQGSEGPGVEFRIEGRGVVGREREKAKEKGEDAGGDGDGTAERGAGPKKQEGGEKDVDEREERIEKVRRKEDDDDEEEEGAAK